MAVAESIAVKPQRRTLTTNFAMILVGAYISTVVSAEPRGSFSSALYRGSTASLSRTAADLADNCRVRNCYHAQCHMSYDVYYCSYRWNIRKYKQTSKAKRRNQNDFLCLAHLGPHCLFSPWGRRPAGQLSFIYNCRNLYNSAILLGFVDLCCQTDV